MAITDMICFNCQQTGHFARQCPNSRPAGTLQPYARAVTFIEHMQRIEGYVQLWHDEHIDVYRKREAIAAENLQYYGRPYSKSGILLTSP